MTTTVVQRQTYRSTNQVKWAPFAFWSSINFAIALAFAAVLNWLFSIGHYYEIIAPIVAGALLLVPVSMAIAKGKCRIPALGGLLGFITAVLLYGGSLYFGMLTLLGPSGLLRFDLLPNYISLRLHTDISHELGHPSTPLRAPDAFGNGVRMAIEAAIVLFTLTSVAYRRAKRAYCEKCDLWKQQHVVNFAPGYARQIAQWVDDCEVSKIAMLEPYTPKGKRKQSTMVAIECCNWEKSEDCSVYLAVKEVTTGGGITAFDGAFGKTWVSRVELSPEEIAGLSPVFPQLKRPARSSTNHPLSPADVESFADIQTLPADQANKVLTTHAKVFGNILSLLILPIFWVSLAGIFGCLYQSGLEDLFTHRITNPTAVFAWVSGAIACLAITAFSGYIGLKNSGVAGNRYYRYLSRKSISTRLTKWVDPQRPGDLPLHFVQVVPRKNWGTLMLETATDTGFMQIDPQKEEIRFEGDVERYRIPFASITSCSVVPYSSTAGNSSVQYWIVVLEAMTPTGKWEAPISNRQTKWLVPANHKRVWAQMIVDQITPYLSSNLDAELVDVDESEIELEDDGTDSPPIVPPPRRTSWLRTNGVRIAITLLVLTSLTLRAISTNKTRKNPYIAANAAMRTRTGHSLRLSISNVRHEQKLTNSPPFYGSSGNWTVFDCTELANPDAKFTIAIETPKTTLNQLFTFTGVAILPGGATAGAQLVADLASAFQHPAPASQPSQPLQTFKMHASVLGQHLSSPETGLKDAGGSWVATRWFIHSDAFDAELYFDYDLASSRAQISETDSESDENALLGLATALRDGPRPPRTPQTDPQFTDVGPAVVDLQLIPNSKNSSAVFARGGKMLTLHNADQLSELRAVSLDHPQTAISLATVEGTITGSILVDPDARQLILSEILSKKGIFTSGDQQQIWWIDRAANTRHQITGPWGNNGWIESDNALSPDARYLIVTSMSGTVLDKERKQTLYAVNLQTGKSTAIQSQSCYLQGWTGTDNQLRLKIAVGDTWEPAPTDQVMLADPTNGHVETTSGGGESQSEISPDQNWSFLLNPQKNLEITQIETGVKKTFEFHPEDRRFALPGSVRWLDSRFLQFDTAHPCFIDTATLKLGYLPLVEIAGTRIPYQFSPDMKWALKTDKSGIAVGRVVIAPATTQPLSSVDDALNP